jgi:hypothetical protein
MRLARDGVAEARPRAGFHAVFRRQRNDVWQIWNVRLVRDAETVARQNAKLSLAAVRINPRNASRQSRPSAIPVASAAH